MERPSCAFSLLKEAISSNCVSKKCVGTRDSNVSPLILDIPFSVRIIQ